MNMELIKSLLLFMGGLGLFLYGMEIMAEGLQQAAGDKTRKMLEALTKNPLMGMAAGALVTAVIQSSSATTVMVVGFVNAGLMSLKQAAGVIMGANIGTTMTSWIVSMGEWASFLKPEMIAPFLLLVGVGIHMTAKSSRLKDGAKILIGFGILFTGLSTMSGSVKPFVDAPIFKTIFTTLGANPLLGILAGAAVTAIIQSSSASMGILQTLAMAGAVNWGSAVFIALGQNIGTCVTAVISAVSGDTNAKRAAMIHLEFNVIGAAIAGTAAWIFFMIYPNLLQASVNSSGLALFHTGFNLAVTILLFPFINGLVSLSKILVPEGGHRKQPALILDPRFQLLPKAALNALYKELDLVCQGCVSLLSKSRAVLIDNADNERLESQGKEVLSACLQIRDYCKGIDPAAMTDEEVRQMQKVLFSARDFHQIAADCLAISRLNQESIPDKRLEEWMIESINTLSSLCEEGLSGVKFTADPLRKERYDKIRQLCKTIRHKVSELRLKQFEQEESGQKDTATSWLLFDTADVYEQIAMRILRLADEDSWQKSAGFASVPTLAA